MIIDEMLFEQEWFSELPLRLRFLYVYLLTKCTKTGIFEVNLRKISYDVNDGLPVTRDDIFNSFGNRVRPLGESKGIFVDYIAFNWVRGKPLDPGKNPLHRGLAQELAKHGLDFSMVCEMANKKFTWIGDGDAVYNRSGHFSRVSDCVSDGMASNAVARDSGEVPRTAAEKKDGTKDRDDSESSEAQGVPQGAVDQDGGMTKKGPSFPTDEWFDLFWKTYPNTCPRKVDKKKCRDKFLRIISDAKGCGDRKFEEIMAGLGKWMQSEMWSSDGGRFIKAPLVWLNGMCWEDSPMKGNGNGNCTRNGVRGTVNAFSSGSSDIARLF